MHTEIKRLTARHLCMMERLVLDGARPTDVCKEFEINDSRLSVLRSSTIWRAKEIEMTNEKMDVGMEKLRSLTDPAIAALADCVNEEQEPAIRLRSAKEILDRAGYSSTVNIDTNMKPNINLIVPKGWNPGQTEGKDESNKS